MLLNRFSISLNVLASSSQTPRAATKIPSFLIPIYAYSPPKPIRMSKMDSQPSRSPFPVWELLALTVGIVALSGSLYLSMGMGLKACPLCLYERTFMMGLVGVLIIGLVPGNDVRSGRLVLVCLPLAVAGLGVAAFHVFLELTNVLECPSGLLGLGSAPQQSLAAFLIITVLLGIALTRHSMGTGWPITILLAIILGILFSGTAIKSAPPLPNPPTEPYTTALEGCRPVFSPQSNKPSK